MDPETLKNFTYQEIMEANMQVITALISHIFAATPITSMPVSNGEDNLTIAGIQCFQAWLFNIHFTFTSHTVISEDLGALLDSTIKYLEIGHLFESAADVLTDHLSNFPTYMKSVTIQRLSEILTGKSAEELFSRLMTSHADAQSLKFARLLLAFGDATIQTLAGEPENSTTDLILTMLHGLISRPGYAVVEDEIFLPALEFWTAFIEFVLECIMNGNESVAQKRSKEPIWLEIIRTHANRVTGECWQKIQLPPEEECESWDSDEQKGFIDIRREVEDLLGSAHPILGTEMLSNFVKLAISSLAESSWIALEASLFCITALSFSCDEEQNDAIIASLFDSSIFTHLSTNQALFSSRAAQTAIDLIGQFSPYFERHTNYLPSVLGFLFNTVGAPRLENHASRSIHSLITSCRKSLRWELDNFIIHYQASAVALNGTSHTKERILAAIATIIQTIPEDEEKAAPLGKLLEFVGRDISRCKTDLLAGRTEESQSAGLMALRCLVNIGRGMQQADGPIDLDANTITSTFWQTKNGLAIQHEILRKVQTVLDLHGQNGEIIEAACCIFRTGFTESQPGPFVFSPIATTAFILSSNINTPRLDCFLTTACAFISSHSKDSAERIDTELRTLLRHILGFTQILGGPEKDPEIAQNCVDFFEKLISYYINIIFQQNEQSSVEYLLFFTLKCLNSREILPKRSASSFWSSLLSAKPQAENDKLALIDVINYFGPLLSIALIKNIGGGASRSELDTLAGPLRRLVTRQIAAKSWLENALFNESNIQLQNVTSSQKRVFLQTIINLRGKPDTNRVVKEFWRTCRGNMFDYAS
ncbi:MAG: hypothetical protein M1829_006463 [Trizodia sp. TS-e1964]|nr:MAG: hypothetical protein M1829_006463 [Trizodia sp. TS-e1964]